MFAATLLQMVCRWMVSRYARCLSNCLSCGVVAKEHAQKVAEQMWEQRGLRQLLYTQCNFSILCLDDWDAW